MTDIEIAKNTKLDEINKIAEKLEIKEEDIDCLLYTSDAADEL